MEGPIISCVFIRNTSDSDGAAISFATDPIENCVFVKNRSFSDGGAIFFGRDRISNNLFLFNRASLIGGATYTTGPDPIANNIFYGNEAAYDGAVSNHRDEFYNNIFWNNEATRPDAGSDRKHFNAPREAPVNSIIEGWGVLDEDGNTGVNPRFMDPTLDENDMPRDFRVQPSSSAIDGGRNLDGIFDNYKFTLDFDQNPRPIVSWPDGNTTSTIRGDGSGWDIGAYEYQEVFTEPLPAKPSWVIY